MTAEIIDYRSSPLNYDEITEVSLTELQDYLSSDEFAFRRLRRLRPDVVEALAASMDQVGQLQPIILNDDGTLIAGWHRIAAAKQLGWETIKAICVDGRSTNLIRLMEIDENLVRADLSPAERAAHHAERKKLYECEFPQTRHGGDRKSSRQNGDLIARYTADAVNKTGESERTVQREVARGAIPDVVGLAGTSLDTPDELDALVKLPREQQQPLIERAKGGQKVSAKTALKKIKRDDRERASAETTAAAAEQLGEKLYGVIYADPPWRFEPWSRETGLNRAADNHYPTATLGDIKALPIPAADDCILFLWATAPMLPEALDVMDAWGFDYKTHCVWLKTKRGTGFWFRNVHELLLIGVRGSVAAPAPGTQDDSVVEAIVGRHSEKPEAFSLLIERLFPNAAKLEMFARQGRDGWDSWGNEISPASS